jgi:hypothetical protein
MLFIVDDLGEKMTKNVILKNSPKNFKKRREREEHARQHE